MYETSNFKKGLYIEIDKVPYEIVDFQHVKPGKGNAFTRTRIKNLLNSNVIERTFKSGETFDEPNLETKKMQYLYSDKDGFQFMDLEAYETVSFDGKIVGDKKYYLTENLEIEVLYFDGKPITIDLPNFVELQVTYTEPGIRGDTASSGGTKQATVSTGLVVNVPLHISMRDWLKIDTRTGSYYEKISK